MASLAATTLLTAGGLGGIALMLWVLHQAGLAMRQAARRLATFLVFLYAVYMAALIVGGIVLRTGVTRDPAPLGLTVVPAALAGAVVCAFLLLSFMPVGHGLLGVQPRRPLGALPGFWGDGSTACTRAGVLRRHDRDPDPAPPGRCGVDRRRGLIAAFVAFGTPGPETVLAVLSDRLIAFWVPTVPEVVAYIRLQRRMSHHGACTSWHPPSEGGGLLGGGARPAPRR